MDNKLQEEASAFDKQILDRINNGHKPDLRLTEKCEYFFNNSWRHPEYVKLDMYEQFEIINQAVINMVTPKTERRRVLEVGCGPGYLSLELARAGHDVIGIDVSTVCIQIANQFANSDPWKKNRGELSYVCDDFLTYLVEEPSKKFDAIVFLGALHHFPQQDKVANKVFELLNPDGIIIVHEPTRDRITEGNAIIVHMIKVLLSLGGGYFSKHSIPQNWEQTRTETLQIIKALEYKNEDETNLQSVNDNEAGHNEIYKSLLNKFEELVYQERYAFFHEIIGGLRYAEHINIELARYLRDIDKALCELEILQSTEFFFVGRKKPE